MEMNDLVRKSVRWLLDHDYVVPGVGIFVLLVSSGSKVLASVTAAVMVTLICWVVSWRDDRRRTRRVEIERAIENMRREQER